jgi:REP element-mobilizing transposase RayT
MSQKLRMDGRDYSRPGWYFLTLGADYHRPYFGRVEGSAMHPNALGELVGRCWSEIPKHYTHVELGAWQVMPNHFHGLIRIMRPGGKGLGEVVNMFKGSVTREWRRAQGAYEVSRHGGKEQGGKEQDGKEQDGKAQGGQEPARVWAPNYYDVICFDAAELAVRENYVRENPRRWALRDVPSGSFEGGVFKGNLDLLRTDAPRKVLRVSRRASAFDIEKQQRELGEFEGVVCSTFFSPGERACLDVLGTGTARIVWMVPMGMPESIPAVWTKSFLEERALWISTLPKEMTDATRASCEQANSLVGQFCSGGNNKAGQER